MSLTMRVSRSKPLALMAALAIVSSGFADQGKIKDLYPNASAITGARLKAHLEFIASDLMEGRDTPSRGLDTAALYVSTQLKLWGLQPMGDNGGFLQKYGVLKPAVDSAGTSFELGGKARAYGVDFYGMPQGSGTVEGGLVYVGEGYVIPRLGINPYEKVDVKGKVVILNGMSPKGINNDDRRGLAGSLNAFQAAMKYGATGVIFVPNSDNVDSYADHAATSTRPGGVRVEFGKNSAVLPAVSVSPTVAAELLGDESVPVGQIAKNTEARQSTPFALSAAKTVKFTVAINQNRRDAENVVAMLKGTDPKLSAEFVGMSAHLDHLGLQGGDPTKVYNGADDDGSGTVSILELAHAFATGPRPKRSVIFIWHSGEEKGLWGSQYFTTNPTIDLNQMVTDLNIDMIGRSKAAGDTSSKNAVLTGPNEIYVVGASKLSTELGKECVAVNDKMYKLALNYKYDAPTDTERIYYRSDHYNYAVHGIPIAFFFDGVHEDYHRMTDKVEKIDFNKMEMVARTVYGLAWTIGNQKNRLVVDGKN